MQVPTLQVMQVPSAWNLQGCGYPVELAYANKLRMPVQAAPLASNMIAKLADIGKAAMPLEASESPTMLLIPIREATRNCGRHVVYRRITSWALVSWPVRSSNHGLVVCRQHASGAPHPNFHLSHLHGLLGALHAGQPALFDIVEQIGEVVGLWNWTSFLYEHGVPLQVCACLASASEEHTVWQQASIGALR